MKSELDFNVNERATYTVAGVLLLGSISVLFLTYAAWWSRWITHGQYSEFSWLEGFARWPWLRTPLLWTLCTILFTYAVRRPNYAALNCLLFPVVFVLTYPGLHSLDVSSDPNALDAIGGLTLLHTAGACVLASKSRGKARGT